MPAIKPELMTSKISPFPRTSEIVFPIPPSTLEIAEPTCFTMFHKVLKNSKKPLPLKESKLFFEVSPNSLILDMMLDKKSVAILTAFPNTLVCLMYSLNFVMLPPSAAVTSKTPPPTPEKSPMRDAIPLPIAFTTSTPIPTMENKPLKVDFKFFDCSSLNLKVLVRSLILLVM